MIKISIDANDVLDVAGYMETAIDKASKDALKRLALATHAHIVEEAKTKLQSVREQYIGALDIQKQTDSMWIITLDKPAMWIEEGLPPNFDMLPGLLRSPKAKQSKKGTRYMIIPFQHNKKPTQQTQAQSDLTSTIKQELKKRKIPYGKIETGEDGKPKTGLLHKFDIMHKPTKTHEGPGQGHGAVGDVRQGHTAIPFLQGIRIYQKEVKNPKTGKSSTQRSVMTFRVASSSQIGKGMWQHPGYVAKHFFEEAQKWAMNEWETQMKDRLAEEIIGR